MPIPAVTLEDALAVFRASRRFDVAPDTIVAVAAASGLSLSAAAAQATLGLSASGFVPDWIGEGFGAVAARDMAEVWTAIADGIEAAEKAERKARVAELLAGAA